MTRKLNLPEKEICKKYLNGVSTIKLAKEYGCSHKTIAARLRDNNIKIRSNSERFRGKNNPNYGKDFSGKNSSRYGTKWSLETREKTIISQNKYWENEEHREIARQNSIKQFEDPKQREIAREAQNKRWENPHEHENASRSQKKRWCNIEERKKLSATKQGIPYDEWTEFSKRQKYCYLFNLSFKEVIRLYFDNKCFMSNKPEENGIALSVHHVNFDKRCGCNATQLCIFVPVTRAWNSRFNGSKEHNRWYWYSFLMNKIFIEHPNYFTYHIPVWGMCELEYNYDYVFEKFRRR